MKLFDADWVEVYLSTDYEEYLRKQIMLREGGMKFKAKIRNNSLRFSMNFLGGRSGGLSRGGPSIKDYYVILVRRADAAYAKFLLG
ncbi:hypothetical protein EQM14_15160 [Caproiciproducens sp. NJN-50]|uniref:hypothetical protein n=1 Tax=Caproiciproducens sp. NJN-50 TaxID=2507162 RepID=UPI000FFE2462|nr:hypothetical protein [Caproiciproducens sp. NJN-50]QAT50997.1 hypothetical protein EQM14_15160 [Caproiciproducens sp. NJN-50]